MALSTAIIKSIEDKQNVALSWAQLSGYQHFLVPARMTFGFFAPLEGHHGIP
jgi:hypothetical protein